MDILFIELVNSLFGLVKPFLAALSPLIAGLVIAYLLNPAVIWFETRIKNRSLAVFITFIIAAAVIAAIIYSFIVLIAGALPQGGLASTLQLVKNYFSDASDAINSFLEKNLPLVNPEITEDAIFRVQNLFSEKFLLSSVIETLSSVTGALVSFFIGCVAAIYLLKDKEFFIGLWEKLMALILPQRSHGIVNETMSQINSVIETFIKGALIDSIIVAFLSSLVLTLLQVEFAVVIGAVGGILNIIPYFGPFISMIPAFLAALLSGGPLHGLTAVAGLFIVQQLDSNYIYPKIVGSTIGLHPLFVLLSVSFSGYFFGIAGMLLAVPSAGIIQVLVRRWAYNR